MSVAYILKACEYYELLNTLFQTRFRPVDIIVSDLFERLRSNVEGLSYTRIVISDSSIIHFHQYLTL